MQPIDIAVAGCGTAGLSAALLLHRDGHRVTLFERFDRPQPVGSGLMIQPTGLAALDAPGVGAEMRARGARIDRLFGQAASGRTVLDVRYSALGPGAGHGIGVHRAALFEVLYNAVEAAGITVLTGRHIRDSESSGRQRTLLFADGTRSPPFDLVVDALGTRTPLAPPCGRDLAYGALWATIDRVDGFDGHALEQRYHRASKMAGVLPLGTPQAGQGEKLAFFWSLRADRFDEWRAAGLVAWKDEVRALWPGCASLLDQITDPDQLTFAQYAHRTLPEPCGHAIVHIGDAWHSASPQLGQGANMALLDAWALALALRSDEDLARALPAAVALRYRHIALYQWLTAAFTPVYQSDSHMLPFVRDRIVGPLSGLWPANRIQAAMVAGLVGNPLARLGLDPIRQRASIG